MSYQHRRLLGGLYNLTKVVDVICQVIAVKTLSPFALAMSSKVKGVTNKSFLGKERNEILLPTPRCVPRTVNEKQRCSMPFSRVTLSNRVQLHS